MPYYSADADAIAKLESRLQGVGLPIVLLRKHNAILNAIEGQIEDEHADPDVAAARVQCLALGARPPGGATWRRTGHCTRDWEWGSARIPRPY